MESDFPNSSISTKNRIINNGTILRLSFSDGCTCEEFSRYTVLTSPCSPSALCWCRRWQHHSSPSHTDPASDSERDKRQLENTYLTASVTEALRGPNSLTRTFGKVSDYQRIIERSALLSAMNTDQSQLQGKSLDLNLNDIHS